MNLVSKNNFKWYITVHCMLRGMVRLRVNMKKSSLQQMAYVLFGRRTDEIYII